MNRERPPEPERLLGTHIPSRGHVLSTKCEKGIFLGGGAPFHPFSPSAAPRDWVRCCKASRHKRLGVFLGATDIWLKLRQTPL